MIPTAVGFFSCSHGPSYVSPLSYWPRRGVKPDRFRSTFGKLKCSYRFWAFADCPGRLEVPDDHEQPTRDTR